MTSWWTFRMWTPSWGHLRAVRGACVTAKGPMRSGCKLPVARFPRVLCLDLLDHSLRGGWPLCGLLAAAVRAVLGQPATGCTACLRRPDAPRGPSPPTPVRLQRSEGSIFCLNLVVLAWMHVELWHGQPRCWWTQTQTQTHTDAGNDNTQRPKLASGKNYMLITSAAVMFSRPNILTIHLLLTCTHGLWALQNWCK